MGTTTDRITARSFLVALFLTLAAAALYSWINGFSDQSLSEVLRYSGRAGFAVLIVVFAARPLQQLVGEPWTAWLRRNRRQLGVTFAGILTAHLILIMIRVDQSAEMDVQGILNWPAAVVYSAMFAMLITSFSGPAERLGRRRWTILHKAGLFILFIGFVVSQVPESLHEIELANSVLLVLAAVALGLRGAAAFRNLERRRPQ